MKKILCLILSLALALGVSLPVLAETTGAEEDFPLPIVDEPYTITIWKSAGDAVYKTMSNLSEGAYWQELEKRTGIHVEFIHPTVGQELASLNLLLAGDNLPDIIEPMYGYEYPGGYETGVADGIFYDITELVDKYCPNYKKALHLTESITKECYTDSGLISGFWNISVGGAQPPWMGEVVRKDWLDDLGLELPVTYDDWYNMLVAFKEKKGATAPLMLYYTGFDPQNVFCGGYGITETFFQKDGQVKYGPLEDGYRDYLAMLAKWYKEGLIDPDFATKKDFLPSQEFTTTGKTGAFYEQYLDLNMLKGRSDDANYQLAAVSTPRVNAEDELHIRQVNWEAYASRWIMTTSCKNPEIVAKWCDYAYTLAGDMLSSYGFEGKTYEMVDGKPQFTPFMYANPDGLTLAEAYHYYAKLGGAGLYHWDREFAGMVQSDLDAMQVWQKDNDGAYVLPPIAMTDEEATEYATLMNDIETYRSEMVIKFILGQEPIENYDAFRDTLRTMNIDRAIEIYQAALERFNSRG